jgi:alkylation response protein AidB-like acyl-CoA dehydrogenase
VELDLTAEQRELKDELRDYFVRLVDEVEGSQQEEATYTHYIRRMGEDGWLGLGWPVEYGGQARGPIEQMIFVEESHWAGVPLPLLTFNSVGPTLMALGTDEQKRRILPGILQGKVHFSIGYSEPSAGTDLASLRTRAVRDGDEYVINGQKIYTSAIQYADYIWLAVRTDPEAPKHKGLSVFIVPVDSPGFSWTPLPTIVGDITSSTFYEDVRVPVENLVGEENQGWKLITNQLNHERVAICPASGLLRSLTDVRRWAQEHKLSDGRRVIDQEWVQLDPGQGARQNRGPQTLQLEGGVGGRQGAESGRRVGDQGLRNRARTRGLQSPPRDRGSGRLPGRRVARSRSAGPARASSEGPDHFHLWGWDQRDPARHHRHGRVGHAPRSPLSFDARSW